MNRTLQDTITGKYRNAYLVYNRKSTDDTANQKNSIKYQRTENARFAQREGLPIAPLTLEGFATGGMISERHSGFKENSELIFGKEGTVQYNVERPKFHRLVQFLNNGYFKGVIFLCWDRASRNKGDDTILRKLMKSGVDVRFALAKYDNSSAGELHMDIDGMFAEHHSRVTREKVLLTIKNKRAQGIWTNKAPVGYLNLGTMEHKPFDEKRAPIIRAIFERAATGAWGLTDLARWAAEQGFTMPPVRRRRTHEEILMEEDDDVRLDIKPIERIPTFTTIHKILTNRFYTGHIKDTDGSWIPSKSHEPIVDDVLFNTVQQKLRNKKTSAHYIKPLNYPLRRMAYCAECGRVYTPYSKKNIIYYGARCDSACANTFKSFNFNFITNKVGELIDNLVFTDDEIVEINARATTDIALLDSKRIHQIDQDERRKKKIREDLAYLNANRLPLIKSGAYTPEEFANENAQLNAEIAALRTKEDTSDVAMEDVVKDVVKLSELLKHARIQYNFANSEEKDAITRLIFSEFLISQNTFNYKCRKGFVPLQNRLLPDCDQLGWLSDLNDYHATLDRSIRELETIFDKQSGCADFKV